MHELHPSAKLQDGKLTRLWQIQPPAYLQKHEEARQWNSCNLPPSTGNPNQDKTSDGGDYSRENLDPKKCPNGSCGVSFDCRAKKTEENEPAKSDPCEPRSSPTGIYRGNGAFVKRALIRIFFHFSNSTNSHTSICLPRSITKQTLSFSSS